MPSLNPINRTYINGPLVFIFSFSSKKSLALFIFIRRDIQRKIVVAQRQETLLGFAVGIHSHDIDAIRQGDWDGDGFEGIFKCRFR
jgi:hypothetical protein